MYTLAVSWCWILRQKTDEKQSMGGAGMKLIIAGLRMGVSLSGDLAGYCRRRMDGDTERLDCTYLLTSVIEVVPAENAVGSSDIPFS